MKKILFLLIIILNVSCLKSKEQKHLFILSGQSNMARLDPKESLIPILKDKFGKKKVIVVKDALGGQPIRRWYEGINKNNDLKKNKKGDLFDSLINKVKYKSKNQKFNSVTFIWMQGERDAREKLGEFYENNLMGLYNLLCQELNREDINFIIGRLNDFDLQNKKYPHWSMIRSIQMKVATSNRRFEWVNTDDLNDGFNKKGEKTDNDLHMSVKGYKILGQRFAEKAIEKINKEISYEN
ncbi:MAG: sialate O-acetylesterase [Flavobacteriaceae bacterium]|nr:sialate O-acetylesterase [Flavobacteriaceae bacterium]